MMMAFINDNDITIPRLGIDVCKVYSNSHQDEEMGEEGELKE